MTVVADTVAIFFLLLFSKQFFNPKIPGFGRRKSKDSGLRKAAGIAMPMHKPLFCSGCPADAILLYDPCYRCRHHRELSLKDKRAAHKECRRRRNLFGSTQSQ